MTWTTPKTAVYVALPVLVSLLLGLLMVTLCKPPVVPYSADTVVMEQLSPQSFSLTGSLCGDHSCSSHLDDEVTDVVVTADRRVVLAMRYQQSIVVHSSSGVQRVKLDCIHIHMTQLPSGRVAATCPLLSSVLLVSLGSSDHQIQRIQTGKQYWHVAAHPVDNTLIVGTLPEPCIDVITLQGEVIRTLMDSSQLKHVSSLTVANGHLLVTDAPSGKLHRIDLSAPGQPPVETIAENLAPYPLDTAVDTAGNVFIVLTNGDVVMRTSEGSYRPLLTGRRDGKTYEWCHVGLYHNRLLLVTITRLQSRSFKSDVTEYQLLDR